MDEQHSKNERSMVGLHVIIFDTTLPIEKVTQKYFERDRIEKVSGF